MTRRQPRHALALPLLAITLVCVALPAPVLADPGKGHGKGQQDNSGYDRSGDQRDDSDDQRGYGGNRGGNSDRNYDKNNGKNYDRDNGRNNDRYYGEKSGRGNSDQKYQNRDDDYDRNSGKNAQQSQSLSPQQAAQRARSQYGGQVLKIQPSGGGYQVRLLQQDGRVVTVPITD